MKFKFDVLLVIFIFLLSGCHGSDFPLIATPVGTDIDTTERVSVASDGSQGDDFSANPAISGDGRCVAFYSAATNLVNDDTNWQPDVFVYDRGTGTTERVSVASDGSQGDDFSANPAISGNGRYVTFYSAATNLVSDDTNWQPDIFVHDRYTGTTERVSVASDGTQGDDFSANPAISDDGRYMTFDSAATNLVAGDTNWLFDIFVKSHIY